MCVCVCVCVCLCCSFYMVSSSKVEMCVFVPLIMLKESLIVLKIHNKELRLNLQETLNNLYS